MQGKPTGASRQGGDWMDMSNPLLPGVNVPEIGLNPVNSYGGEG